NDFGIRMHDDFDADTYLLSYKDGEAEVKKIIDAVKGNGYNSIVLGIHDYSLRPANNYGISASATSLYKQLQQFNTVTMLFGNVLALSGFCDAKNLVACYQDDAVTHQAAADMVAGKIVSQGTLP